MKIHLHKISLFITLMFLASCAGYHFNTNNNPLIGYDIRSISVPMFVNRTSISNLSPMITKEIILALNDYTGLKVYGGEFSDTDAVLLGILESEDAFNKTFTAVESLTTDSNSAVASSIGTRQKFYYPVKTNYKFKVRFVFIKRPTAEEITILTSDLGKNVKVHPKVVLDETLDISGDFTRAVADNSTSSSGGAVNFVKNKGLFNKSLQDVCIQAASSFKQVVLNAF